MKNIKIIIAIGILIVNFKSYAQEFIYKGIENINATVGINKKEDLKNICEIKFYNLSNYKIYGATLSYIEPFITENNPYDFGDLISYNRDSAILENGTIHTTNTYRNSNYYYPIYAINGYQQSTNVLYRYWMASGIGTYKITFNNPVSLSGINYSDTAYDRERRTYPKYNISIKNCNGETFKDIEINENWTTTQGSAKYLNFSDY